MLANDIVDSLLEGSPEIKTLKNGRTQLDSEERQAVIDGGATWSDGKPGVWKSVVKGKTWYVSNTHRAYSAKSTLKAAIAAFAGIESTS